MIAKAKNDKAQRADQKSGRHEEVNYVGSLAEILTSDLSILSIENPDESKVLLTTKESSTWLLDSGTSYHVTPHQSQFWQYSAQHTESVRVENSQHCAIIRIGTIELNPPGGSTPYRLKKSLYDLKQAPREWYKKFDDFI